MLLVDSFNENAYCGKGKRYRAAIAIDDSASERH